MPDLTFAVDRAIEDEDETHPTVYEIVALEHGRAVGELRYAPTTKTSFLLGVSVRYERLRRGIASDLLDEWVRRSGKRRLQANVARENTPEGEALLRAFSERSGVAIERIDTGLDGRW